MIDKHFKVLLWVLVLSWLVLVICSVSAQEEIPVPPALRIVDQSHVLTPQQIQQLSTKLKSAADHVVIGVIIIPTTMPEDIFTYSMRVFDAWKLGGKGKDNGVLVTIATVDHKVRITTGIGTEGRITDMESRHIIDAMKPNLHRGDYYSAVSAAIERIHYKMEPEPLSQPQSRAQALTESPDGLEFIFWLFGSILVIFFAVFLIKKYNDKEEEDFATKAILEYEKAQGRRKKKPLFEPHPDPVHIPHHQKPVSARRKTNVRTKSNNSAGSDILTGVALGVLADEVVRRSVGSSRDSESSSSASNSSDSSFGEADSGGSSSGGGSDDSY